MRSRQTALSLLPAVLFTSGMIGLPVLFLFVLGFFKIERGNFTSAPTTEAYASIFTDHFYIEMFFRSLWIALFVTLLCLLVGYPIAYLFYRAKGR